MARWPEACGVSWPARRHTRSRSAAARSFKSLLVAARRLFSIFARVPWALLDPPPPDRGEFPFSNSRQRFHRRRWPRRFGPWFKIPFHAVFEVDRTVAVLPLGIAPA